MKRELIIYLAGSLFLLTFVFSGCKKALDERQTPSATTVALQENPNDTVSTPDGPRLRSQVHIIKRGDHVALVGNHYKEINPVTGEVVFDFGEAHHTPASSGTLSGTTAGTVFERRPVGGVPGPGYGGNGWLTEQNWTSPTGQIYAIATDWVVPTAPVATYGAGQTLYIWYGIQETSGVDIIQPVLQYGYSAAGGGNGWYIDNWFVFDGLPEGVGEDLVQVQPGAQLVGDVYVSSVNGGGSYNYTSTFIGFPQTTAYADNQPAQPTAVETLEVSNLPNASYFPTDVNVRMTEISGSTVENGGNFTTNFVYDTYVPNGPTTNIEQAVLVNNASGSTQGEVDIYFHAYSPLYNPQWSNCLNSFSWTAIAGATSYQVGVTGTGGTTNYNPATTSIANFLPATFPNGNYYVTITANNTAQTQTYYAITKAATTNPVMGLAWNNSTLTLSWNAVPGATSYEMIVQKGPDGGGAFYNTAATSIPNFFSTVEMNDPQGNYTVTVTPNISTCSPAIPYTFTYTN